MLSALTIYPANLVATPYWLKIDTDTISTGAGTFPQSWFKCSPSIIASPWGYSKPPGVLVALNGWAHDLQSRGVTTWANPPIPGIVEGDRIRHPRVISWLAFLRTEWTQRVVDLLGDGIGEQMATLPVRSHDTFYGYVAERQGQLVRKIRMKNHGWDHVGARRLAAKSAEALGHGTATKSAPLSITPPKPSPKGMGWND